MSETKHHWLFIYVACVCVYGGDGGDGRSGGDTSAAAADVIPVAGFTAIHSIQCACLSVYTFVYLPSCL